MSGKSLLFHNLRTWNISLSMKMTTIESNPIQPEKCNGRGNCRVDGITVKAERRLKLKAVLCTYFQHVCGAFMYLKIEFVSQRFCIVIHWFNVLEILLLRILGMALFFILYIPVVCLTLPLSTWHARAIYPVDLPALVRAAYSQCSCVDVHLARAEVVLREVIKCAMKKTQRIDE